MELMFDLQSGDTSVSSAAANFGEVGGPGMVKSTYTTSTWCPLGPLAASAVKGANGVSGDLGAPGAGAGVVVKQATPVSLSDDCGARLGDHQANGVLLTTDEGGGRNTPSETVPVPSGRTRLMTGDALMGRLRRLPGDLVRSSSSRSVDRVVEISGDKDGDSDESTRYGLAEAKRKLLKLTHKEQGLREEDLEDRAVPPLPVHKSCKRPPPGDAVAEEMWRAPTPDLGAVINDRIQVIEKVARCSANQKGTNVRALREAALLIRYAAAEQAKWTVLSERELGLEREVRDHRARLTAAEALSARREARRASPVAGGVAETAGAPVPMEVRVGVVRRNRSGLGGVWAKCPVAVARRLAAAGRLLVGWSSARVEVLAARPLRWFRCLEEGHVRRGCPCDADRGGRCYSCGGTGYVARECTEAPKCPVCTDLGRPAGHRLGGKGCAPSPSRRRRRGGATAVPGTGTAATPGRATAVPGTGAAATPGAAAASQPRVDRPGQAPVDEEGGSGRGEAMDTA
ncbi:hypothetical protein WN55_06681 [Dufourea novaeangliae]|uniref:CCHC-type domain-containing protein n=1 Tax=Dufourea novaeangliae TaxID=178035 RepID=A0A154PSH3_DUFNO|nr:hypothetical protein WN55_06681 [Dufourea novaeangliae]